MSSLARRLVQTAAFLAVLAPAAVALAADDKVASAPVRSGGTAARVAFDGVVQAVRQTVVAAQVQGAVIALPVKAGDSVRAGQMLLRLDARAAEQNAAASAAQVQAARSAQDLAASEYARQEQLHRKNYISQAALERARAQLDAARSQAAAQLASAGAARTESGFYTIAAPYAGVVADVPVVLGDMALPGRPLVTLYDPAALRVSVMVPQSSALEARRGQVPVVELPGLASGPVTALRSQWLPTADPATHSVELRLDLPPGLPGLAPGQFARVWLPAAAAAAGDGRLYVPASAVVRRAELMAVYVLGADGRAQLRQVRLGRPDGSDVEVLSGVSAGERVALDPQAAARQH